MQRITCDSAGTCKAEFVKFCNELPEITKMPCLDTHEYECEKADVILANSPANETLGNVDVHQERDSPIYSSRLASQMTQSTLVPQGQWNGAVGANRRWASKEAKEKFMKWIADNKSVRPSGKQKEDLAFKTGVRLCMQPFLSCFAFFLGIQLTTEEIPDRRFFILPLHHSQMTWSQVNRWFGNHRRRG